MSRVKEDIVWMLPSPTCRRRGCFSATECRNRPAHEFRADGYLPGSVPAGTPFSPIVRRRLWKECGTQVHQGCPDKWRIKDRRRMEDRRRRRHRG